MTQYVVDTSILVQQVISDQNSINTNVLIKTLGNNKIIIPEFCLVECTNVIWKYVRFHGLPQSQAELLVGDLTSLPLTVQPIFTFLEDVLEIGIKHKLAIYDSVYIAIAKSLNSELITVDVKQSKAAQNEGITLKPITDFV